jgi:hypothetical protein
MNRSSGSILRFVWSDLRASCLCIAIVSKTTSGKNKPRQRLSGENGPDQIHFVPSEIHPKIQSTIGQLDEVRSDISSPACRTFENGAKA